MTFDWSGKRRWIALLLVIASVFVMLNWPPVVPVIQLPGEKYPGGRAILDLPITNTLVGSVVVWILIGLLIVFISRNRPRHGGEVPRGGFYNLFEMAFEGLYGFIGGIAPAKYLDQIFRMFMTIFVIVLLSNWLELVPGIDSIGFLEPHVETVAGETVALEGFDTGTFLGAHYLNGKCPWVSSDAAALLTEEQMTARADAGCQSGIGAPVAEVVHQDEGAAVTEAVDAQAGAGDAATVEQTAEAGTDEHAAEGAGAEEGGHHYAPGDPSVPWVMLPYVRVPSTDLNLTVALALIAVIMIQVIGFQSLGIGYLTKFFNFGTLLNSPLGGIDVAVGLLELIGEFAKILSFAFRLLGNIFAGSILLFVMSFLVPVIAPWPFFLLEFFVGIIQALVFGLLTAIFMSLATVGHHGDDEHHEGAPEAAH